MPYGFAENLFDKTRIGMRIIIAPNDAEPVEFSDPALPAPNAQALADAPARAETLADEVAQAAKMADEAKSAAAVATRAAAPLTASLRKLESGKKTRADAALAVAEKVLAAAMTDEAKARAEDLKQKAAAKAAELATQLDIAKADAKTKLDAAKKADTAKAAHDAMLALEPVAIFISRATQRLYVRRGFGANLEVPVTIRNSDKPIGTHVFTAVARTDDGGPAVDRGHDRQRRKRQGCARPRHHPAGCARSHRADRTAAILDRHLGRAAEPRDQLSHGVRRGAEQPATGRPRDAQAPGR